MPTDAQYRVLEAAQEPGLRRTKTAICIAADVSRDSLYRWLREDPDFRRAYEDIWRPAARASLAGVVAAQVEKALDGDLKAAEFVARLAGVIMEGGGNGAVTVQVQTSVSSSSVEHIERAAPTLEGAATILAILEEAGAIGGQPALAAEAGGEGVDPEVDEVHPAPALPPAGGIPPP